MLALSAHVTFSLMVWKAFARNQLSRDWFYIPLAVLYHAAVDVAAVWAAETLRGETPLLAELVLAATLVPGWAWAVWLYRRHRAQGSASYDYAQDTAGARLPKSGAGDALPPALKTSEVSTPSSELSVFRAALSKELRQLWRTKRLLAMGAVFLVFGMGSPLLAKLTPELLGSLEGAEMFADLIPTPTAGDAMAQYIKNLSQFGFILAVLLGMGAVAGEKERSIVPMILSKPMPRWAFVASKFAAQSLMYLVGFLLAGLGAGYYTLVLFGPLDPGGFTLLNGLLFLWLLTFVALSLLGSILGATTAAAGGIGLALSVGLMLLGSLPQYGALLPGGLMGWAALVGQAAAGIAPAGEAPGPFSGAMAGGGAAASAVVVVVMALLLSIGFFEQQEL
jgi:ABC-2 type transport system permease protein